MLTTQIIMDPTAITDEGLPGPVDELEVRPLGVSSLHLSWNKPKQPNGILLGYEIKYIPVIGTEVKWSELAVRRPSINDPEIVSAKLAGLQPNTSYRVYVAGLTKIGPGDETFVQAKTFADNASVIAKPSFLWHHERNEPDLVAVRVNWKPTFDAPDKRPGSHFYVQYREYGRTNWISAPEVFNEDFDVVRGLNPGETYVFRVVAVDGSKSATSDEEEIYSNANSTSTNANDIGNNRIFDAVSFLLSFL